MASEVYYLPAKLKYLNFFKGGQVEVVVKVPAESEVEVPMDRHVGEVGQLPDIPSKSQKFLSIGTT